MGKPAVLFLCTGNSARSQMAEAFLKKYGSEYFEAYSAGTDPKGLNPLTVRVMGEVGIDMQDHRSKHLREYLGRLPVRVLVIVCTDADKSCPTIWPGVLTRLVWAFDDPAACDGTEDERLATFREIRDQIQEKVKGWLAAVMPPAIQASPM